MTMSTLTTPRIYVASLSDYNAGELHGEWIDADQDADEIHAEIQEMLAASPQRNICQMCGKPVDNHPLSHPPFPGNAEEWAIHDYDNFPGGANLGEYESIEKIAAMGQLIAEHGWAFEAWLSAGDNALYFDPDTAEEDFNESYVGEFESERHFAYHWVEECGLGGLTAEEINACTIDHYFDWDAVARSLFEHGDHTAVDHPAPDEWGVIVFRDPR
jgi:antirestriction protein